MWKLIRLSAPNKLDRKIRYDSWLSRAPAIFDRLVSKLSSTGIIFVIKKLSILENIKLPS